MKSMPDMYTPSINSVCLSPFKTMILDGFWYIPPNKISKLNLRSWKQIKTVKPPDKKPWVAFSASLIELISISLGRNCASYNIPLTALLSKACWLS